jgi:hypothetical protein
VIREVVLRRFKRFDDVRFPFPGHIVLAGPNNTGKTTVLQAIAAWGLALERWRQQNDFKKHGGGFTKVPIARQAFSAVPLRLFDLLWRERDYQGTVEIEIRSTEGWVLPMELIADSTEQIYVRPRSDVSSPVAREAALQTVFVPAMSGLGVDEPVYQRPKIDHLLGQAKPGEVLRNLLVEASKSQDAWDRLREAIGRLFRFDLLVPDASGPHILAEYQERPGGPRLDIASAGSGFQQVLMLLTFLHTRPASVLLLDEPDAHLHVILQDAIYGELRSVATLKKSQLVIATHSEVIINTVVPEELCALLQRPRLVADAAERTRLAESLRVLSNEDILRALDAPGILYLEDSTDLLILREWARILGHPALDLLNTRLYWRRMVAQPREGASGVSAKAHFEALRLVRDDLPGLQLIDGDAHPEIPPTDLTGHGLQRLRWRRYEIESYLLHPAALDRFVENMMGPAGADAGKDDLREYLEKNYTADFVRDPHNPGLLVENLLKNTKARTDLLPPILTAAGLPGFAYQNYHQIAAVMRPEEIHPEVREKLDGILKAFRL